MASADPSGDDLNNFDFASRSSPYYPSQPWNMNPIDHLENMQHNHAPRRHVSPIQTTMATMRSNNMAGQSMIEEWQYQELQQQLQHQHQQQQQQQAQTHTHQHLAFDHNQNPLDLSYNAFHNMSIPTQMTIVPVTQTSMPTNLAIDQAFLNVQPGIENISHSWSDLDLTSELIEYTTQEVGMPVSPYNQSTASPNGSHLEVLSQQSSANEDWTMVDSRMSFEPNERPYFVDPTHTLHDRSRSESSSDFENSTHHGFITGMDIGSTQAVYSPTNLSSDSDCEYSHFYSHSHASSTDQHPLTSGVMNNNALVRQITIPSSSKGSSPVRSPTSSQGIASSPGRKPANKKSPIAVKITADRVQKKVPTSSKIESTEKRVGRRKGPLSQEQRKQASEIRKLRACLRCKFLKKTCDKGDPCAGCQPSHARLWQVPCTRIDIKDIGYFLKDRKFDYERHLTAAVAVPNLKGFSADIKTIYITHGYGHMIPIVVREVYVRDDKCMKMDWIEANGAADGYEVATSNLTVGSEGVPHALLSEYLDLHIDTPGAFEKFVDDYFDGTPFLTQMLKVAFRFYDRTGSSIIKKALKLMLAYAFTVHITMWEGATEEESVIGRIDDESSRFYGKIIAPVMVNFEIKYNMSEMWRELHKDVLEDISALYSSVYSGDKLKNWPTIFMLASILLAVWEFMQFDCRYRTPDEASVEKFCSDMETTPVGVIVGLFSAISQKLPSILEWDTSKHAALLDSNPHVCRTMEEARQHVSEHETYLRNRPNAKYDDKEFDCLSNKFLSRLVLRDIRAN